MKTSSRVMLGAAVALPWLFIWQGVDVTDQGYLLTIYRQFLHHPESVGQAAHMWLTNLLGGLWDAAFGGLGAIAHRAQWAVCLSLGLWVAFRAVRRVTDANAAALAVLATALFVCNRRETWFSYNVLTALLNAGAVAFMLRGLAEKQARFLLASGALLGLSPFARLPNVLGLALLCGPLFVALIDPPRRAACVREVGLLLAGVLGGATAALSVMAASGCFSVYRASLLGLFAPEVAKTGHGTSSLIQLFIKDQSSALLAGAGTCVLLAALHLATRAVPRVARLAAFAIAAATAVYGLAYTGTARDPEHWRVFVLGTCYVALLAIALGLLGKRVELRSAAFLAFLALVLTPLGSDQGTRNSHWGMWFALPLLIATLWSADDGSARLKQLRDLGMLAVIVVMSEGLVRARTYTYREAPRELLTHRIQHPQLRGLYTSEERARVLQEVVEALEARVAPGDYLLTSESTPLLQYLTHTRPYLGIPWIMVDESPPQVDELLRRAPREKGCLPPLVRARGNPRSPKWPNDVRRGVDRKHAPVRKVIASFLKRHGYAVTWKNSFFEILQPAESGDFKTLHCR